MGYSKTYDVIIVGGGLAGLTTALHLSQQGVQILLLEKYEYPHHKVCGEYISNEVMPYLRSLGVDPFDKGAVEISEFEISSKEGNKVTTTLPLGGFGISRHALDFQLYELVKDHIDVVFAIAEFVSFQQNSFTVSTTNKEEYYANFVVGAFGKRSLVDTTLDRNFMQQKSPWLAVKGHYKAHFPKKLVALHNFEGGYCGLSHVETGAVNACYLTSYKSFKRIGSIPAFQKEVMCQNPHLKEFFSEAELLFEKPLTISQISFEKKLPIEEHIFMIGDSAGLIHPLCGNGMAMAIHGAKLFSELFLNAFRQKHFDREDLERAYQIKWEETFTGRLQTGRRIQKLLLHPTTAHMGLKMVQAFPSILPKIIKRTHGELLL